MRISTLRHPEYTDDANDMNKWRLTAKGGRHFIDAYLRRFSNREDNNDFADRKAISYCPAFGKAALNKLKNTFYSRMSEIVRRDGPQSYIDCCEAKGGGVDRYGSSMSTFMGQDVLFELMSMRRVGVFVDRNPFTNGETKAANKGNNPYLYYYRTEDILTWDYEFCEGEYVYKNVLLRDYVDDYDEDTGMIKGVTTRYRQVWMGRDDGKVHIQFWIESSSTTDKDEKYGPEQILDLPRIPFVFGGLQESLLADVCDYQVAMLNVASADINYVYKANFPFYTEEYDAASESVYTRRPAPGPPVLDANGVPVVPHPTDGTTQAAGVASAQNEISVGTVRGRRYPRGGKPPQFIAPPTEPLMASIAKQNQMKDEIFQLIDLAASRAQPQHASAQSKQMDDRGLESGLSYIGLELEYMEREIAKIWASYENGDPATVAYPTKYTLKSDQDRIDQAKALNEVKSSAPSRLFAKEVGKQIVEVMLADKIPIETIEKIKIEIDKAAYISSDPELIKVASELGMVDATTGSNALGFEGEKVVPKAQEEHAKRLKEISDAQSKENPAARGVPDKAPTAGKDKAAKDGNA